MFYTYYDKILGALNLTCCTPVYTNVNILYHTLSAFKCCSARCAGKVRIDMAGKGAVLTEFYVSRQSEVFFNEINVIQIKWLLYKRHYLKSIVKFSLNRFTKTPLP